MQCPRRCRSRSPVRGPVDDRPTPPSNRPALVAGSVLVALVALAGCRSPGEATRPVADRSGVGADAGDAPAERSLAAETRDWVSGAAPAVTRPHTATSPPSRASAAGRLAPGQSPVPPSRITVEAAEVPLAILLAAIARDAGVELAAHALPTGRITATMADRPLPDVLDRLADQQPFHWRLDGDRLVVRGDVAYADSYAVDYLNLDRTTRGSVGLATRVGSIAVGGQVGTGGGSGGGSSGAIANGSETLVENVAEHRFWESLARDVGELLDPESTRWSINRDAGLVTLDARPAAHERLASYLDALQASARRQVLIEATVLEVALSDSFEAGIDWQVLAAGVTGLSAAQIFGGQAAVAADTVARVVPPAGLVSLVQRSGDGELSATLSLLETFGEVRILSRPRILALNNQSSVLKVVDNRVYFTARVERRVTEEGDEITTGTEIHTVPVGLVMNVTPFIGAAGDVMLNVRPTLSRILGFVDDPNPELALANVRNSVPEIQVREMESMLRVSSGDVAIIGGLMQESTREGDRQLPGLARLPLVGGLFTRANRERSRTELLIVLRPTVMPG